MNKLESRLDEMERAICKPLFRKRSGKANEVNFWIFDYPPECEYQMRERIEKMKKKNQKGIYDFNLVVFDLYDIMIEFLEKKNFLDKCILFEKKQGFERISKAVNNSLKVNDRDSFIAKQLQENTPENSVVILTGIGKCYPILRSHKVLNNLHQAFSAAPVVLLYPGMYDEQQLVLFNEIKDDNYYRAFRIVK